MLSLALSHVLSTFQASRCKRTSDASLSTSDASLAAVPKTCLALGSTPACQLCVGVTLRVGDMLPVRRVSDPMPVRELADPTCGKALVPWSPVACRLRGSKVSADSWSAHSRLRRCAGSALGSG